MADKYGSLYDHIVSYQITVNVRNRCIGGNDDRAGGILIHPVRIPFIQATGLAGAMRGPADEPGLQNHLFGSECRRHRYRK